MIILEHYSAAPLGEVQSRAQERPYSAHEKPKGLWVSVPGENDWPSWCKMEDFGLDRLAHRTRLILSPGSRLLLVDNAEALSALEQRYGFLAEYPPSSGSRQPRDLAIDWPAVARDWQGIVIAPYQWEARWESLWYGGWDCASGCIWDAGAICGAVTLPSPSAPQDRPERQLGEDTL